MNEPGKDNASESTALERERTTARARIAGLVADAEKLLEVARQQAAEMIEDADRRAEERVRQMTAAAQSIVSQAKREAAMITAEAESAAAATIASQDQAADGRHVAEAESARSADEFLRVAKAEAQARAQELMDETHRKIENAETEARRRLEAMRNDYRTMQQRIRQDEFAAKARLLELREETAALESKLGLIDPSPGTGPAAPASGPDLQVHDVESAETVDEASVAPSEKEIPGNQWAAGPDTHTEGRSDSQTIGTATVQPDTARTLDRFTRTTNDPQRALRGIRRRA